MTCRVNEDHALCSLQVSLPCRDKQFVTGIKSIINFSKSKLNQNYKKILKAYL